MIQEIKSKKPQNIIQTQGKTFGEKKERNSNHAYVGLQAQKREHYLEPPGGKEAALQIHDFPHFQACLVSLVLALGPQVYL